MNFKLQQIIMKDKENAWYVILLHSYDMRENPNNVPKSYDCLLKNR